ncbi:MAG: 50S ribosomal protein L6 [bacterium]|nr:50S ribosomal protein L6 [bacterium]
MSKLAKKPIEIPKGVEVRFANGVLTVKGPKGTLSRNIPNSIQVIIQDNNITIKQLDVKNRALLGTYTSHIKNMIKGLVEGFEKKLEVNGIGYKAEIKSGVLKLSVGFSHPVEFKIPEGVDISVSGDKRPIITVSGIDKQLVGNVAANIRAIKPVEPYNLTGIKYTDEVVVKKAGKAAQVIGKK